MRVITQVFLVLADKTCVIHMLFLRLQFTCESLSLLTLCFAQLVLHYPQLAPA